MNTMDQSNDPVLARILAGAFAHLALYLDTGCHRSAYLAAILLEQIASQRQLDAELRRYALQLIETLERSPIDAPGHRDIVLTEPIKARPKRLVTRTRLTNELLEAGF